MFKVFCTSAILAAGLAFFVGRSTGNSINQFGPPAIIARIQLTGKTAPIPQTTVFTPAQNGVYRATAYMSVTTPGDGADSWFMNLFWTDEAGLETSLLAWLPDATVSEHAYAYGPDQFSPAGSITFRGVSGVPVTYDIDNNRPSGVYEAFLVIERLE